MKGCICTDINFVFFHRERQRSFARESRQNEPALLLSLLRQLYLGRTICLEYNVGCQLGDFVALIHP